MDKIQLKGLTRRRGHAALARAAGALEKAARDDIEGEGIRSECAAALAAFTALMEPAIASLKNAFVSGGNGTAMAETGDGPAGFAGDLDRFEELLRNSDAEAQEVFRAMTKTLRALAPDVFGQISLAMNGFDFDAALELVPALRDRLRQNG